MDGHGVLALWRYTRPGGRGCAAGPAPGGPGLGRSRGRRGRRRHRRAVHVPRRGRRGDEPVAARYRSLGATARSAAGRQRGCHPADDQRRPLPPELRPRRRWSCHPRSPADHRAGVHGVRRAGQGLPRAQAGRDRRVHQLDGAVVRHRPVDRRHPAAHRRVGDRSTDDRVRSCRGRRCHVRRRRRSRAAARMHRPGAGGAGGGAAWNWRRCV